MKYTIVIQSAPTNNQASHQALKFTRAVLDKGHTISRLFFYSDGVLNASNVSITPQGETDLAVSWQSLIDEHDLDAVVCIAAALKRGVLDQDEAKRYEREAATLKKGFELSGLGQLVEASNMSDRVITFA